MPRKSPADETKEQATSVAEGIRQELTESRRPWYYMSHAARVLLGITLWIYLKLKERGVLETERARDRSLNSKTFRSFTRK